MTLSTFPFAFWLLAIWISLFCESPVHVFVHFYKIELYAFFLLTCRNSLYSGCKILVWYIYIYMETKSTHSPSLLPNFNVKWARRKHYGANFYCVYLVLRAESLKLMNKLWTGIIWGHCACHRFHSALCFSDLIYSSAFLSILISSLVVCCIHIFHLF